MSIKPGDRIKVDKGICGIDYGVLISVDEFTIGGFNGIYKSDKDSQEHIFDETVHQISLEVK